MSSGVRECFVARPGFVWAASDYASLELAMLAQANLWLVGYSKMAEAINAGKDLNTLFGSQMMGVGYEDMKARLKAGDPVAKGMRQAAKAGNYGLGGGMGAAKLASTQRKVGLSLCTSMARAEKCGEYKVTEYKNRAISPTCLECIAAAEHLKREWLRAWPEMRDYLELASQVESAGGEVEQLVSKRVRGGCTYSAAANTLFQGLAADGAKRALWLVTKECFTDAFSTLYGSRPVAFVHDEIILETPEAAGHAALKRLQELMVAGMKEFVPDVAVRTEGCLMRRWYKGAEPVVVDGRVVPSKPEVRDGKTYWVKDV